MRNVRGRTRGASITVRVAAIALAAGAVAAPARAAAQTDDEAAVRRTVELYMESHATGDGQYVARAFHPQLTMFYVRDGQLMSRSAEQFISGFRGQPAADESQRRRWIEMVDVSGSAAIAKVILDYPQVRFTDYFTLLKVDGEWKIMNKVFHSEAKSGS